MKIPVLYYHKIDFPKKEAVYKGLYVTPVQFKREIGLLKALGYRTISPDELLDFSSGRDIKTKKPILITFDDGFKNNFTNAFPVMKEAGFTGTVFISCDFIGKRGIRLEERETVKEDFLDEEDIRVMARAGFYFGSHGKKHCFLDKLGEETLREELSGSKKCLEDILKMPVKFFSYPYGKYDERVVKLAREAGYIGAFTTNKGRIKKGDDPYKLKRIPVSGFNNLITFFYKIIFLQ